jgi:hypothetical protein
MPISSRWSEQNLPPLNLLQSFLFLKQTKALLATFVQRHILCIVLIHCPHASPLFFGTVFALSQPSRSIAQISSVAYFLGLKPVSAIVDKSYFSAIICLFTTEHSAHVPRRLSLLGLPLLRKTAEGYLLFAGLSSYSVLYPVAARDTFPRAHFCRSDLWGVLPITFFPPYPV